MAQQWYARTPDGLVGPFSSTEVRRRAADGEITPETHVSPDQKRWVPASRVKGLFPEIPQPAIEAAPEPIELAAVDIVVAQAADQAASVPRRIPRKRLFIYIGTGGIGVLMLVLVFPAFTGSTPLQSRETAEAEASTETPESLAAKNAAYRVARMQTEARKLLQRARDLAANEPATEFKSRHHRRNVLKEIATAQVAVSEWDTFQTLDLLETLDGQHSDGFLTQDPLISVATAFATKGQLAVAERILSRVEDMDALEVEVLFVPWIARANGQPKAISLYEKLMRRIEAEPESITLVGDSLVRGLAEAGLQVQLEDFFRRVEPLIEHEVLLRQFRSTHLRTLATSGNPADALELFPEELLESMWGDLALLDIARALARAGEYPRAVHTAIAMIHSDYHRAEALLFVSIEASRADPADKRVAVDTFSLAAPRFDELPENHRWLLLPRIAQVPAEMGEFDAAKEIIDSSRVFPNTSLWTEPASVQHRLVDAWVKVATAPGSSSHTRAPLRQCIHVIGHIPDEEMLRVLPGLASVTYQGGLFPELMERIDHIESPLLRAQALVRLAQGLTEPDED